MVLRKLARSVASKSFSPKAALKNANSISKKVAAVQKKANVEIKAIKKQADKKITELKKAAKVKKK